jgi:glutaminyl-tRNA synthetase
MSTHTQDKPFNFIQNIIHHDLESGKHSTVKMRFPPEPNGFLHIGHAKSIIINFGLAKNYSGSCHLRFDDTNPVKESIVYTQAITNDLKWLGFPSEKNMYHSSDHFDALYQYASELIQKGLAYVCELSSLEMREYRGTLTHVGKNSPYRDRSIALNMTLFQGMKDGKYLDGQMALRAKIDMQSPNMNMRDPVIYRIKKAHHIRTGNHWCIYPTYDFTHGLSDAIENITHSLCTLEFEDHRPLYDWFLNHLSVTCHPQQIEFSRLNLEHTITSKRKLNQLVSEGVVDGWDDPRMPTISGMRRRGYSPLAIKTFIERTGVTKKIHTIEMSLLENTVREDLENHAPRAMAVLNPLKVTLTNYPEHKMESLQAPNHPKDESMGKREIFLTQTLWIDQADFKESANKRYKRLVLGKSVRLRNAYVITCHEVVKDKNDVIVELKCTYDDQTLGKNPQDYKAKGVIHWVSEAYSKKAVIRLYDRLFTVSNPALEKDFLQSINPHSLHTITEARVEHSLSQAQAESIFQFEREGYFCADRYEHTSSHLVFNRTVTLRDRWEKIMPKTST